MDKDTEKLQTDLRFAAAFLKAHEEVKANEAERQKRIYEKAVIAAENRRKKKAEERECFSSVSVFFLSTVGIKHLPLFPYDASDSFCAISS